MKVNVRMRSNVLCRTLFKQDEKTQLAETPSSQLVRRLSYWELLTFRRAYPLLIAYDQCLSPNLHSAATSGKGCIPATARRASSLERIAGPGAGATTDRDRSILQGARTNTSTDDASTLTRTTALTPSVLAHTTAVTPSVSPQSHYCPGRPNPSC